MITDEDKKTFEMMESASDLPKLAIEMLDTCLSFTYMSKNHFGFLPYESSKKPNNYNHISSILDIEEVKTLIDFLQRFVTLHEGKNND